MASLWCLKFVQEQCRNDLTIVSPGFYSRRHVGNLKSRLKINDLVTDVNALYFFTIPNFIWGLKICFVANKICQIIASIQSHGALVMRASLWAVKGNKSWGTLCHNTLKETCFRIKCLICGIIPPTSVQMLCDTSDFCFDTLSQHSPHNIVYHSFFRETSYNIYPDGSSLPTYSRHCHETKCWKLLTFAAELQECSHLAFLFFYFSTRKMFSQNQLNKFSRL